MFKTRLAILLLALSTLVSAQVPTGMPLVATRQEGGTKQIPQGLPPKSPPAPTSLPRSPVASKVPGPAQASDLLVLRDGTRKSGSLVACGITTCLIGTWVVPRQNIAWIGLSLSPKLQAALPPVQNSATDELHLADDSVHSGALLGILADSVATVKESLARQAVKWVHLVPVHAKGTRPEYRDAGSPDSGNGGNSGNASNSGTPGKTGRPAPPAAPPGSTPPKPPAFPDSVGSRGGLWIGTAHGEKTVTYTRPTLVVHHYKNTIRVKLREVAAVGIFSYDPRPFHRIGSQIDLINEGTQYEGDYQGPVCSDHAKEPYRDIALGHFWYKTLTEPIKNGIDIPPEGLYTLTFLGVDAPGLWHCQGRVLPVLNYDLGGNPIEIGYLWGTHAIPPDRAMLQADDLDPEGYRKMSADHARMVGDYNYENQFQDGSEHVRVDWDLCRIGSAGCVMGAPQFNPRPCTGATSLGPCSQERNALAAELKTEWGKYQKYMAKVQENQGAYRKAIAECAAWDAAMKIVEYAVGAAPIAGGGLSPQSAAEIKEFQEALSFLTDISEKIINGENPLTIPDSKGLGELAKLQWSKETITKVLSMFNAANPEAMHGYLEECGAPVPAETYAGAVEYVKNLKEAMDMVPEIQQIVNRIRGKDLECQVEQWKAYQACVECARSQGTDEKSCNNLKQEGDWPDVP